MDTIIIVKDRITKKRIAGAYVEISPEVGAAVDMFTDENGEANFGEVWAGLYSIRVAQRHYKPGMARGVELPATVQIGLIPWWAVGLGIVTGTSVVILVVAKVAQIRRYR